MAEFDVDRSRGSHALQRPDTLLNAWMVLIGSTALQPKPSLQGLDGDDMRVHWPDMAQSGLDWLMGRSDSTREMIASRKPEDYGFW